MAIVIVGPIENLLMKMVSPKRPMDCRPNNQYVIFNISPASGFGVCKIKIIPFFFNCAIIFITCQLTYSKCSIRKILYTFDIYENTCYYLYKPNTHERSFHIKWKNYEK